jgi:hypothetical protein
MHHKRKRPKSTRAGCLMCKPWKRQGSSFTNAIGSATDALAGRSFGKALTNTRKNQR